MERVPQLVKTLRRTYAHKLGALKARDGDPYALVADMEHIRAVILMFWPSQDFAAIKPVRPHTNHRGAWGPVWFRAALDVLRTAEGPLTAQEITRRILAARGEPADGPGAVSVECSLLATLGRRAGVEIVRHGEHRPYRWALSRGGRGDVWQ